MVMFVLLSYPIPWAHWHASKDLNTREETFSMIVPVADYFPWPANRYVEGFDSLQRWLIEHYVCERHQTHKVFVEYLLGRYPSREEGMAKFQPRNDVAFTFAVGVSGWVLPQTAIIDIYGLNDYVVARTPPPAISGIPWRATVESMIDVEEPKERRMAHDRVALKQYVACFKPNISGIMDKETGRLHFERDAGSEPPTDAEIIACEDTWWAWADKMIKETKARKHK
jgi:hypothetical protein